MDFSGIGLQVDELNNKIDQLVEQKTEKVVVRATSNEGFISGLSATITLENGRTYDTPLVVSESCGIAEIYIKYGTSYTVSVQSYQGVTPSAQNFTADRSARDVIFHYNCDMV